MSKYQTLLSILDHISDEARKAGFTKYFPVSAGAPVNGGRSRAYVHLFLKVKFGLLDPTDREKFITDGTQDGGVDAFFIDRDEKVIFFIQSKFRTTEANFDTKTISLDEIVSMEIGRITSGHTKDEFGIEYNGKIQGLIRSIREIPDIARYQYKVILIANLHDARPSLLQRLTGGFPVEVFDAERCYSELVFPVITGTYYDQEELHILLDLSNKNAGAKISYEVSTQFGPCEITVLFVPTIEIAKTMSRYRNSILRFNPRSYLELDGGRVNQAIRQTMVATHSNEFALLNNGITMISDETNINERIGQRNKAQLSLRNPQIINGGQTAYTLSRLFEENNNNAETFENKEVLLKIITVVDTNRDAAPASEKRQLIDRISAATNQQTAVTAADRSSSETVFTDLQKMLFDTYGVMFERKRGEFQDGIKDGYVRPDDILERNLFFRIYLAANGRLLKAREKRIFLKFANSDQICADDLGLDRFYFGYCCYRLLERPHLDVAGLQRSESLAKVFAMTLKYFPKDRANLFERAEVIAKTFSSEWTAFIEKIALPEKSYLTYFTDRATREKRLTFNPERWFRSPRIERDIRDYFSPQDMQAGARNARSDGSNQPAP